jgi:hypothetical protein
MTKQALEDGISAFRSGTLRTANPHDPSSEAWMCWRDGWEQAKVVTEHEAAGTSETAARFGGSETTKGQ